MKKMQKITVRSFVHVGDELVDVDTLTQEQKIKFGTELRIQYLNALFAGKAVFYPAHEFETASQI